ncbi:hypothetical protein KC363_g2058 [Hortaea werneckii]|nr:hypothetical protein KC361_g3882 [Hortaea werneckii]KAI6885828.1 hypothetical protein KC325_g3267 [Hortaea werneckii]KAI6997872.1 hypothetical protein KC359_g2724 [Hortaea werneckii]KAI7148819.1 hypothetical protein KC344_g1603 [Hortaea werneckii]KAI7176078.1 hypothetical protein KC360_g3219 [Hortaea werneckii]
MASRRRTQSHQQQQQGQEQQHSINSSWFLNSSTGLYYYYNSQTDEFIYQNGARVPRPSSIPRAGLLEQHREAGSNNNQETPLPDSPNWRNDTNNYTYAAGAQFEDRSSGGESLYADPRAGRLQVSRNHARAEEDDDEDEDDDELEEDSSADEEEEDDDDNDNDSTEQQIHALTQRGYTRQEALRFLHLTSQQGYSREQAVIIIQYLRQGYTFAQAVTALQQSPQPRRQEQQRRRQQQR